MILNTNTGLDSMNCKVRTNYHTCKLIWNKQDSVWLRFTILSCETFCTCIFAFRSSDYLFLGTSFQVGKIHECKIFNLWRTVLAVFILHETMHTMYFLSKPI